MNQQKNHRNWLLYGATGYTGRLIALEAVLRGVHPVLAGRNEKSLRSLADDLGCSYRCFAIDDPRSIAGHLDGCELVLNCAGPYGETAEPMVEACLLRRVHYLDITGEIPVMEMIYQRHDRAVQSGVVLLPSCGYDVVPTDCLAAMLKEKMPNARRLRIAFTGGMQQSPGTWKTTIETIPRGGLVRQDGKLVTVPHAWKAEQISFNGPSCWTITIPWGDLSSAYRSTGIRNIEVYACQSRSGIITFRMIRRVVTALLRWTAFRQGVQGLLGKYTKGPSAQQRDMESYRIRGDAWDGDGNRVTLHMRTPEAYATTVNTSLACVKGILEGNARPGAHTPSTALGSRLVLGLRGVTLSEG